MNKQQTCTRECKTCSRQNVSSIILGQMDWCQFYTNILILSMLIHHIFAQFGLRLSNLVCRCILKSDDEMTQNV